MAVTDLGGSPVVERRSADPEYRARLVRAASVLRELNHPGAEALVGITDDGETTALRTAFAGGRSLRSSPPSTISALAGVGAALARTLADLHDLGIAHGPIGAHQVILGTGDRPVLCGFADGHLRAGHDTALWQARCAADLRSLGNLLGGLARTVPGPRAVGILRRVARRRLARTAAKLGNGDLSRTDEIIAALDKAARQQRRRGSRALGVTARRRRLPRRALALLGVAGAGISCVGLGLSGLTGSPAPTPVRRAFAAPAVHDGDLDLGGTRFHIGRRGDRIVFGDWNGDGVVTPALLRPTSGAVFFYASWPSAHHPLRARPVAHVAGAVGLRVRQATGGGDGDTLVVLRSSASPVVVTAPPRVRRRSGS